MVVFNIKGIDYVHISDFAKITQRQVTSTRHLIEDGNVVRRLKALRIRSMLFIPVVEIDGYPFSKDSRIYHYKNGERKLCEQCTFTNDYCSDRLSAEEIEVPEIID